MDLQVGVDDTTTVIAVEGELDVDTAYDVYLAAADAAQRGATTVVLDLSGVRFLDSTGLGMLVRCRSELATRLVLRSPSDRVTYLLRMTALTDEFEIDNG